jgi:trigger factor
MTITKVGLVERAPMEEALFKASYPDKDIKTPEEFRQAIRDQLQAYWDKQSKNHLQHELYHVLLEHTNIEFPETFLKRWIQSGSEKPKTQEQVEQEFPMFVNQLKWSLISDKIVRENNIEVTKDDLAQLAKKQLFGYMGMPEDSSGAEQSWVNEYVTRMMSDKKFVEDAYHRIQTDKVLGWAEEHANATDIPVSVDEFTKELEKHQHHHH